MREVRTVRKRVLAWVLGLATSLGVAAPARAQTQPPVFGMIGLAQDQVAILNLVLVDPPEASHPGCQVTASFVDAKGQVFSDVSGNPVKKTFTLQPQIATGLRLYAANILAGQPRRSIRAVLTPVPNPTTSSDCRCLTANVELVDPNGRTALLDNGQVGMGLGPPSPWPPGGTPPGCALTK